MSKPIIYAAFANKDDNHLPLLKQESSEVKDALRVLETRDFIKVEREESAEIKDIINTFSSYPNQISIFHYGGHAESDLLQLEDTDANAKGLASILGEQENLYSGKIQVLKKEKYIGAFASATYILYRFSSRFCHF